MGQHDIWAEQSIASSSNIPHPRKFAGDETDWPRPSRLSAAASRFHPASRLAFSAESMTLETSGSKASVTPLSAVISRAPRIDCNKDRSKDAQRIVVRMPPPHIVRIAQCRCKCVITAFRAPNRPRQFAESAAAPLAACRGSGWIMLNVPADRRHRNSAGGQCLRESRAASAIDAGRQRLHPGARHVELHAMQARRAERHRAIRRGSAGERLAETCPAASQPSRSRRPAAPFVAAGFRRTGDRPPSPAWRPRRRRCPPRLRLAMQDGVGKTFDLQFIGVGVLAQRTTELTGPWRKSIPRRSLCGTTADRPCPFTLPCSPKI